MIRDCRTQYGDWNWVQFANCVAKCLADNSLPANDSSWSWICINNECWLWQLFQHVKAENHKIQMRTHSICAACTQIGHLRVLPKAIHCLGSEHPCLSIPLFDDFQWFRLRVCWIVQVVLSHTQSPAAYATKPANMEGRAEDAEAEGEITTGGNLLQCAIRIWNKVLNDIPKYGLHHESWWSGACHRPWIKFASCAAKCLVDNSLPANEKVAPRGRGGSWSWICIKTQTLSCLELPQTVQLCEKCIKMKHVYIIDHCVKKVQLLEPRNSSCSSLVVLGRPDSLMSKPKVIMLDLNKTIYIRVC